LQKDSLFQCFTFWGGVALILLNTSLKSLRSDVQDVASRGKGIPLREGVFKNRPIAGEKKEG
jgi:hypothetical protein